MKICVLAALGFLLLLFASCESNVPPKKQKTAPVVASGKISQPDAPKQANKTQPVSESESESKPKTKSTLKPKTGEQKSALPVAMDAKAAEKKASPLVSAEYDPTGKTNPFIPLIQEKKENPVSAPEAEEVPKRILTPLEKLELSQIRLVAVVEMKNRKIAMVEEASGKGYEVTVGTYMGKNSGQVFEIGPDSIVVKEYVKTYKGNREERFQEIKLHKKEE